MESNASALCVLESNASALCVLEYNASALVANTGWRKFPDHFKGKKIRFFQKIGFLDGLNISALQH
jgi:hypothetical protein